MKKLTIAICLLLAVGFAHTQYIPLEPLLIITNGVYLQVTEDTNLITVAKVYPNGIELPYTVHNPRIDTNHTIFWTYRSNSYRYTFLTEPGTVDTNTTIKTPITN